MNIKELGKRLAARLDEDDWNYIEPFVNAVEAENAALRAEAERLTRQRDLAVSAATKARNGAQQAAMVCPKKLHVYPALLNMIEVVDDALSTLKESET